MICKPIDLDINGHSDASLMLIFMAYRVGIYGPQISLKRVLQILFFLPYWLIPSMLILANILNLPCRCIFSRCHLKCLEFQHNLFHGYLLAFQKARTTHCIALLKNQAGLIFTNISNHQFLKQNLCETFLKAMVLMLA